MGERIATEALLSTLRDLQAEREASPPTTASAAGEVPPPRQAQQVQQIPEPAEGDTPACPVCMVNQMNVALGCGHRVCSVCLPRLRNACPVCRQAIGIAIP